MAAIVGNYAPVSTKFNLKRTNRAGTRHNVGRAMLEGDTVHIPDAWPTRNTRFQESEKSGNSAPCSAFLSCAKASLIGVLR